MAASQQAVLAAPTEGRLRHHGFAAWEVVLDHDADGFSSEEEIHLFHTDPLKTDTDGDGLDDCAEVLVYRSNPSFASSTGRGAIEGRVVLDEDRDPATRDYPRLRAWTVFVDRDADGEWDDDEPSATTAADGSYRIAEIDPGFYRVSVVLRPVWTQIFPSWNPMPTSDGYPDRVVQVFDSGTGPIPFPFGRYSSPLPGTRVVSPSRSSPGMSALARRWRRRWV